MNKPIIRNIANAIKGSYLTVITGEELMDATVVFRGAKDGKVTEASAVNATAHTLTCRVPDGAYQSYGVKVVKDGVESNEVMLNVPTVKWVQGSVQYPGREMRIFGQGFVNIDRYEERSEAVNRGYGAMLASPDCTLTLTAADGREIAIPVIAASNYEISAVIPEDVKPGSYDMVIDANCGGKSEKLAVEVKKADVWPDTVFNVCDFGARSMPLTDVCYENFFDNTEAFQRALDAAGQNGGGVVFVPNGRYCFKGELRVPRFTRLVGEDVRRTWLELPKGTRNENGWGTYEEGGKIRVFIGGYGDFSVENLNICGVYSPILIGAPVIEGEPVIGDDKFNRIPCYCNLIDQTRDADNVTVRNCYVIQEPTFLDHHKQKGDIYRVEEYDRNYDSPYGPPNRENYAAASNVWTAIAIKGCGTRVCNNTVQGGGTCVALMGALDVTITGNTLYCGDLANCIGMFSTSYNPNDDWKRPCRHVVIENNQLEIATNLNRGVMWIMQDHCNYYIANNHIKPFFWHSDAEGFCFHIWGDHLVTRCTQGKGNTITIDMEAFRDDYKGICQDHTAPDGRFIPHSFRGGNVAIVGGTGMGQLFRIVDNTEDTVTLDHELDCELDATSRVNLSDSEKFFDTIIVNNIVEDLGRGVYHWGPSWGSIVDGNLCSRNSGVLMEDLSSHTDAGFHWTFAGEYFNQIINNRLIMPRGYSTNFGVIGVKGGVNEQTTVSMIIRGNVAQDDAVITALPLEDVKAGLNYEGIVIENNYSLNCQTGIMVSPTVSATLKDNEFCNVDVPVEGLGAHCVEL